MFAIDCLKANGTHLGTCIDRFYFGSCCHIEPLQDITENTIDAALIPSREPPHRITTNAPTTSIVGSTTNATQMKLDQGALTTTTTTTTTIKAAVQTTVVGDDLESYKITTFQSVDDVPVTTTIRPKPAKTKPTATIKPTSAVPVQTTKPTTKVTKPRPQTTPKPSPTYINRNTTTQLNATRPQTTTPRLRPKPTKPVKITKPIYNATSTVQSSSGSSPTPSPNTQRTTVRSSTTTRSTKLTKKPSLVTKGTSATRKPSITSTTRLPVSVTTTKPSTATIKTTTKLTTIASTTTATSTLSNEVLVAVNATINDAQKPPDVNGNPATNEIESPHTPQPKPPVISESSTTPGPSLVTWSEIQKNNTFNATYTESTTASSTTISSGPSVSTNVEDGKKEKL